MGAGTKQQRFPYSFKTVAVKDTAATDLTSITGIGSVHAIGLEVILPKDFYACEGLYAHLRFSGTSASITNVYVLDDAVTPTWIRTVPCNYAAVSSVVDARIDVTALKNTSGRNIVFFNFNAAISGTIKIFKVDMLYQVVGIR